MFLNWLKQNRQAFGLRLDLWFFAVLVLLSAGLFLTAYFLLSQSIAAKDRDIFVPNSKFIAPGTRKAAWVV